MEKQKVLDLLYKTNVIITNDHFVYSSGKHGSDYIDKTAVFLHPRTTLEFCFEIASHFLDCNIDVVLGPAVGGAIVSQWVTFALNIMEKTSVIFAFADKTEDGFTIKRGFRKLICDKNVLLVDDVLHTGGSIEKVIKEVRKYNANIIGLGFLFDRGGKNLQKELGIPNLFSCIDLEMTSFDKNKCPMCEKNIPINTDFGKGKI